MNLPRNISRALSVVLASLMALPPASAAVQYQFRVPVSDARSASGTTGALVATPAAINFGVIMPGSNASQNVTLQNVGGGPTNIAGIDIGTPFSQLNNCPATLESGASCQVTVTYAPPVASTAVRPLNIMGSDNTVLVSASGIAQALSASLSTSVSSLSFSNVAVGQTSTVQSVTVTNSGNSPATVDGIGLTNASDFAQTNNCSGTLAVGATCAINVNFTPSRFGLLSSNLSIFEASSGSLYSVALAGAGSAALMAAAPTLVNLGNVVANSGTASGTVTVTNSGNLPINNLVASVPPSAFAITNSTCGSSLAGGASCVITVAFTPVSTGTADVSLQIASANAGTTAVALKGNGQAAAPNVVAAPTSLAFPPTALGASSPAQSITFTNQGNAPAPINSVNVTDGAANFQLTSTCGASLNAGQSCTASVVFAPTTTAAATGTVVMAQPTGIVSAALTGTGTQGKINVSRGTVTFGAQQIGATSVVESVIVTNGGTSAINFSGISVIQGTTDFAQSNDCGGSLAVNASCTLNVTFTPSSSGVRSGNIALLSDAAGVATISLSGTGQTQSGTVSAPSFSATALGSSSTATATVTNTGTGPLSLVTPTSSVISGSGFGFVATSCGTSIPVGNSCTVTVSFTPVTATTHTGTISITAGGKALTASLSATGSQGSVSLSAPDAIFGAYQTGTTAPTQTVTVTNAGQAPLVISSVTVNDGSADFSQSNNCTTIAVGAACNITVTFAPSVPGTRMGTIALTHNGSGAVSINLGGTGQAPSGTLSTPSFTATAVGQSSTATAILSNTGIGPLSVTTPSAASVSGPGFGFGSTTCGTSVAVGDSCQVIVRFAPTAVGNDMGALTLNTGMGVLSVPLGSTGIQGYASVSPSALTFTTQPLNTTAAYQTVTVTNVGTNVLTFTGVGIVGSTDYQQTNDCGSVAIGGTCSVNVNFTPAAGGSRSATLAFTHDGGGIALVSLSGTGAQGNLAITPGASYTMPAGSSGQMFTIKNTGTAPAVISTVAVTSGPYTLANNCAGTAIPVGGTCRVRVWYSNFSKTGTDSGTVSIASDATGDNLIQVTASGLDLINVTASFDASSITEGQSATFTWNAPGASSTTVTCRAADGVYSFDSTNTSGSVIMSSLTTTITCEVIGKNAWNAQNYIGVILAVTPLPHTYDWAYSAWTSPTVCGTNVLTRTITCQRDDGLSVNWGNCSGYPQPSENYVENYDACTYTLLYGPWSVTLTCGTISETRVAFCQRNSTVGSYSVDMSYCPTPLVSQTLTDYSICSYAWQTSSWVTPAGCGTVTSTRTVSCQRSDGTTVADANCTAAKPAASQGVTDYSSCTYSYAYGAWSGCSASCGSGTQSRGAVCERSDGSLMDNSYCGTADSTQSCTGTSC